MFKRFPGPRRLAPPWLLPLTRQSSTVPVKSYTGMHTPLKVWWHKQVPLRAKYFSGIICAGLTLHHLHPNVLITLGPPVALGSYFLNRKVTSHKHERLVNEVLPGTVDDLTDEATRVAVEKYDETSLENVERGIENPFDFFRDQMIKMVEERVVEFVARNDTTGGDSVVKVCKLLDENGQVQLYLDDSLETLVLLRTQLPFLEGKPWVEFIRFSVPFFSSKDKQRRHRIGVCDVSLLEIPEELSPDSKCKYYKVAMRLTQYRQFNPVLVTW